MSRTYSATRAATDVSADTSAVAVGDDSNDANVAPFAARVLYVDVDFGTVDSQRASTSVLAVPWVKAKPRPIAQCIGRPTTIAFVNDEDALVDQVRAIVTNIVDGVSFDVVAYAPEGTNGIYTIQIMGV